MMHDSRNCPVCGGLPVEGTMSDEQFAAFLNACRDELEQKQSLFWARVQSAQRWWFEAENATLSFDEHSFPITLIGTHSAVRQTWLWAWANECYSEQTRTASRRLQEIYRRTGFRVFLDPGMPASSSDAQDLAAFAVHELDAIGFYRCPSEDGPTLYVAIHEPQSNPAA